MAWHNMIPFPSIHPYPFEINVLSVSIRWVWQHFFQYYCFTIVIPFTLNPCQWPACHPFVQVGWRSCRTDVWTRMMAAGWARDWWITNVLPISSGSSLKKGVADSRYGLRVDMELESTSSIKFMLVSRSWGKLPLNCIQLNLGQLHVTYLIKWDTFGSFFSGKVRHKSGTISWSFLLKSVISGLNTPTVYQLVTEP